MYQPYSEIDQSNYRGQFGANLRRLRTKVFETQIEFAWALEKVHLHVHKNTISNWELGVRTPPVEILPAIARILGCTVAELMPEYNRRRPITDSPRYDVKE